MKKLILLFLASSLVFCSCQNILDVLPNSSIQQDENPELPVTRYKSEADLINALDSVYISLGEYIKYQSEIEKLYLVDKNFDAITPSNATIEKAWTAAYDAIKKNNHIIRSLDYGADVDIYVWDKYMTLSYGILGFIYKNIYEHWGNAPIIAPHDSELALPLTANENEVWNFANQSLECYLHIIENFGSSDSRTISHAALLLALSEISGYQDFNRGYDYSRQFTDRYQADIENIFELKTDEGSIQIYTSTHAYYFRCEYTYAMGNWDELGIRDFNTLLKRWDSSDYGYWSMLKRNKKLSEITGCPEHMNYFPVPQKALNSNPNLLQNPGY